MTEILKQVKREKLTKRLINQSLAWYERAEKVIPSCTQTFSKGTTQYVKGVAPIYLVRGEGSHVFDVDGNEYIDYPMALGPVVLGHNDEHVTRAIVDQLKSGITFTMPHPLEVELAEKLVEIIPCAEMVRFAKNGSDATTGSIRAARAFTGKDMIAACGYHGWHDWYIASTTRDKGIPSFNKELIRTFEYNNIDSLRKLFEENPGKIAAVILEPLGLYDAKPGFLEQVKETAHANGAVLIFDEIISGFKLSLGGAQEYYGVTPDLACFGKAMANGMPLSAVVGKREIMEIFDKIFFSFTFGGETLSLRAALATIHEIQTKNVIKHLWKQGQKIKDGYNQLVREIGLEKFTECVGLAPRTIITFQGVNEEETLKRKSLFQQECLKRGVLFIGVHHICLKHSDADIIRTLEVYREALKVLKCGITENNIEKYMEGEFIKPIFRRF